MSTDDLSTVEVWGAFELSLLGSTNGNPFVDTEWGAEFTHEDTTIRAAGFYNGDGDYRLRFMPTAEESGAIARRAIAKNSTGTRGPFCAAHRRTGTTDLPVWPVPTTLRTLTARRFIR